MEKLDKTYLPSVTCGKLSLRYPNPKTISVTIRTNDAINVNLDQLIAYFKAIVTKYDKIIKIHYIGHHNGYKVADSKCELSKDKKSNGLCYDPDWYFTYLTRMDHNNPFVLAID